LPEFQGILIKIFFYFPDVPVWIGANPLEFFFYRLPFRKWPFFSRTVGARGLVSEAMLLHYKRRIDCHSNHVSICFRSGCVLLEGGVSAKFFKALLNRKKSIISIDSGGRETYFGPINLGQNFLKIFEFVSF